MSASSLQSSTSPGYLTGDAKLLAVTKLIEDLKANIMTNNLSCNELEAHLENLKIYGRDPSNSDPIFTKTGMETLGQYAFGSYSNVISQGASRCLANAMLLRADTRQLFVDLGLEEKACEKLGGDNQENEFLLSRILFLTTYNTQVDLEKLIDNFRLAKRICANISNHAQKRKERLHGTFNNSMDELALVETLKLTFNITQTRSQRIDTFSAALKDLLSLLTERPLLQPQSLDPLIWSIINVIMNLELDRNVEILFPESMPNMYVDYCVKVLDLGTQNSDDHELEQEHNISSLVLLLQKIFECAPQPTKDHICQVLLPSREDRQKVLGCSESLPSRILRLSSNPLTPQLQETIPLLLYELSGKDVQLFIQSIGYGYASGFLMKHNIQIPENALESWSTEKNGKEIFSSEVNPVTGQFVEKEASISIEEMTIEEKEREAEKLFVLFERINKTGVITVPNYLKEAVHSGKFEKLEEGENSD